jgi:hypothetical protein
MVPAASDRALRRYASGMDRITDTERPARVAARNAETAAVRPGGEVVAGLLEDAG